MESIFAQDQSANIRQDRLTPYKITLMALANVYIDNLTVLRFSFKKWTLCDEEERDFFFTWFDLLQGEDTELADIVAQLDKIGRHEVTDALSKRLKELRSGVHSLLDLFEEFDHETCFGGSRPLLTGSSVVGIFIRRTKLQFLRLSFESVTLLYESFCAYYDACFSDKATSVANQPSIYSEPMSHRKFEDESIVEFREQAPPVSEASLRRQTEFLLAQQAHLLEFNELEALPPKVLQQKIRDLLKQNPDLAEAHYVSYLNSLRLSDYCWALDSLHHYFDRQQRVGGSKQEPDACLSSSQGFSYAALNLAAVQYRFGNWKVARAAVLEAVCAAQESNDTLCLQHALGWIQRLGMEGVDDTEFALKRLSAKSTELNMHTLASSGVLASVQNMAQRGCEPHELFERLSLSDAMNCQHSMSHLTAVSLAQRSALWAMYGRRELCSLYSQLVLHLNMRERGVCHAGEPECMALCQLATLCAEQGDWARARALFDFLRENFALPYKNAAIWQLVEQKMLFNRSLTKWQWQDAERAVSCLAPFDEKEAGYRACLMVKERGELSLAMQQLEELLHSCQATSNDSTESKEFHIKLLLLKSELECASGQVEVACETLINCQTLCRQFHLEYLEALSQAHIAFVQQQLGIPGQALHIVSGVLVRVLSQGTLQDRARVLLLWAKCRVAAASTLSAHVRQTSLTSASQAVTEVIAMLTKLQSHYQLKDAYYYQARIQHELGNVEQRNLCASQFKELDLLYPTSNVALVRMF